MQEKKVYYINQIAWVTRNILPWNYVFYLSPHLKLKEQFDMLNNIYVSDPGLYLFDGETCSLHLAVIGIKSW